MAEKGRKKAKPNATPSRTMKAYTGPDRLSKLPPELLEHILDLAYAEKPPGGVISLALLPLQRRCYRQLNFTYSASPQRHVKHLLRSAVRLERLDLAGVDDGVLLLPLLPAPMRLRELALTCGVDEDYGSDVEIEGEIDLENNVTGRIALPAFLSPFSGLENLTLTGDYDFSDPSLHELLSALPLRHLTMSDEADVAANQLLDLIKGPARLPHLERLTLDMFSAERGYDADDCDYKPWRFEESWTLADWPADCTLRDVEGLKRAAQEQGIELDGSVLEALEISEEFRAEQRSMRRQARARKYRSEWDSDEL
ncbi:hypothetical protein JCM10213_000352 [Rhodosporidiobolus nylandii]